MTLTLATTAYERKDGGFRGVVIYKRSGQRTESSVLESVQAARFWVRTEVDRLMAGQSWAPGYIYKPNWGMNVWTR